MCKCHGSAVIEIKCPFKIRNKTVREGASECDFLTIKEDNSIILKTSHKYYTQVTAQMALTKSKLCYFITWTELETYIQKIHFDAGHWEKIETS